MSNMQAFALDVINSLEPVISSLGDDSAWLVTELDILKQDITNLTFSYEKYKNDPMVEPHLKHALEFLIPDRKTFIMATAQAKLGTNGQAILDAALNIAGRLLAAGLKHFLI